MTECQRHLFSPADSFQALWRVSYHSNHGTGAHVLDEFREKGSVLQVNVVLHQQVFAGLQRERAINVKYVKDGASFPSLIHIRGPDQPVLK